MAEPFSKEQRASVRHPAARGEARCAGIIGERLSRAAGVIIGGVDLSRPLSSALRDHILTAFRDHHVVVFPDQSLTREQQFVFSASFGEVEHNDAAASAGKRHGVAHVISNLDVEGRPVDRSASPVSNYRWHTDKAYRAVPPLLTTLYAVELPAQGGNTEFASTVMGYLALPLETKRQIAGLRVVFRWGASREGMSGSLLPETGRREHPPVDHPLVRTHPDTGARALYLGNHSSHILGRPEYEGRALLDRLLDHTTQRQFVYAHRWRQGDLVMWDNRCLLHRAVADYRLGQDRRIMHRTVVRGSVPV